MASGWVWPARPCIIHLTYTEGTDWLCYVPEHNKLLLWPALWLNRPEDRNIIHVSSNSFLKHGILRVNQIHTLSPENRAFAVMWRITRKSGRGTLKLGVGAVRPWGGVSPPCVWQVSAQGLTIVPTNWGAVRVRWTNPGEDAIKCLDTQAELGDTAGSAPVHSNKAHTTIKPHSFLVSLHI